MKLNGSYELHLNITEASLWAGTEWPSHFSNWLLVRVESGTGYWMHTRQTLELESGTVLVLPPESDGSIRASQVGRLSFSFFCVDPMRLMGLMTVAEQTFFRTAALRDELIARHFPAQTLLASKVQKVFSERKQQTGSLFRLLLLQLFLEAFGNEMNFESAEPEGGLDAKQRLEEFLRTTQTSELINLSFSELLHVSRCTPRHLSRIFREVVGMSFRDKRAELRLAQACDLLATTELKIVDVALDSGFQSLSLFNLMFARRFGMSPGKWRQKFRESKSTAARGSRRAALVTAEF
jgi:AraC-like DNA-binding protein